MNTSYAVLHIALNPHTGAWSVMRELAKAQAISGQYAGVGIGVIRDREWPAAYMQELKETGLPFYETTTPKLFGTASFMFQHIRRPGIEAWISKFRSLTGAERVVVHFHNAWMSGVFLPLRDTKEPETVCVATFHGVNAELEGQPLRHSAHRWMAKRLVASNARLTSVDGDNLDRARELFNVPQDRFTVIPNGAPQGTNSGRPFALGDKPFTIGHVGTLSDAKGWKIAVSAVEALQAQNRDVRILIAGTGEDAGQAEARARENPDFISFRGYVQQPRENLMPELDLLTVMSVREGLPMTIIEAQSVGVPVAATAVGGIPDSVKTGESGFLVDRTSDDLARVIENLYDHPDKLMRISERTHGFFKDHFAIEIIVEQYHELYTREDSA